MNGRTERYEGRFIRFAAAVLALCKRMPREMGYRQIADQLIRSGSSVGANVYEAQSAQSTADFISKMEIALKEIRETHYWLAVIKETKLLEDVVLMAVDAECEELTAILAKTVLTAKKNRTESEKN
jgi:four helix bundle protein